MTYQQPQQRPAAGPSAASEAFWTGGARGELLIFRCQTCRRYFHPPAPICWRCRSIDVAPEPVSGRGRVGSYTINRQSWLPGMEPPYVVALVELADEPDVRLITNVVDIEPADVRIGLDVAVFFENWTADDGRPVWVPLFRPVAS